MTEANGVQGGMFKRDTKTGLPYFDLASIKVSWETTYAPVLSFMFWSLLGLVGLVVCCVGLMLG